MQGRGGWPRAPWPGLPGGSLRGHAWAAGPLLPTLAPPSFLHPSDGPTMTLGNSSTPPCPLAIYEAKAVTVAAPKASKGFKEVRRVKLPAHGAYIINISAITTPASSFPSSTS